MTHIPATWSDKTASLPGGRAAPGALIGGRYSLRAAVGHGGMGTVWRATDSLLRRDVAVKEIVLPPGLAPSDRDAMYERMMREARAAAALSHPAVVQVYDVVTEGGRPWIVLELLDARSLADIVVEDGPLAPRAVAKIGIALLGALEVAHAAGVLHRDVKPANVLICSDGRCVLTDFGVARMPTDVQLTTPGMVLGSPHFISPERAMGGPFGPPSDLFSLGVTLYTAVEGRPPFDKGDPIETMHAVVQDPPAPPVRAGALAPVLAGLLDKDPDRRWDVTAARTALRDLLAGPLASRARDHVTDPYAVVAGQQPGWQQPPPTAPAGQIGGRAMLAPDESLTGRLAQLREHGTQPPSPAQWSAAGLGHLAGRGVQDTSGAGAPAHPMPAWAESTGETWVRPVPPPRRSAGAAGSPQPGALGGALDGLRRAGGGTLGRVRSWPRRTQLMAGAGALTVLLVGVLVVNGVFGGPDAGQAQAGASPAASAAPSGPPFPVQRFEGRGVAVNVPKGWKKAVGGVYVDFVDPEDHGRKVRILAESSTAQPHRFMEIAERGLKKNCPQPYARVDLRDVTLAGLPAAELEYTCGEGNDVRHGIWREVTVDGKAHSFFLTTTEDRFEESKPIFDEMVRSFALVPTG